MSFLKKTTCKKDFWVDENGVVLYIQGEPKLPFLDWVYLAIYNGDEESSQEYISLYEECACSSECYDTNMYPNTICYDLDAWMEMYEDDNEYALSSPETVQGVRKVKGKCKESFDVLKVGLVASLGLIGLYLIGKKL